MKLDTILLIFAFVLAFLTGIIAYQIRTDKQVSINDFKELNDINRELQLNYSPILRLDLNNDYPNQAYLELLRTQNLIQDSTRIFPKPTDCLKNKMNQLNSEFVDKNSIWTSFLCKNILLLPRDFFKTGPFIDKNGKSFAFMYYGLMQKGPKRSLWFKKHSKYMHIDELRRINWPLNQNAHFLYSLTQKIIDRILANEKVILTENFYLLRTGNLKYFVLDAHKAYRYFKRAGYVLSNTSKNCFIKIGNVCWQKRPHNLISFLSQSSIILFAVTLTIFFLTANALYQRIKQKKLEEERKRHALRVLTHELRTPVASLLLQMEEITNKVDNIPEQLQEDIFKIENEVYRLKRLAEKSKSYLQTQESQEVQFNKSDIYIRDYCLDIIDEYPQISINLEIENDFTINTDPYWLKMCITNLIENSIRYGKAPITIKTYSDNDYFYFDIKDEGEIKYNSLKEIFHAKHTNSKGLGLGLKIIEKTLKFLGGELLLKSKPTTFTIRFKRTLV